MKIENKTTKKKK